MLDVELLDWTGRLMDRTQRHQILEWLLQQDRFEDQARLAERLSERCGTPVTQAMVSRDLKAIGAVKRLDGSYGKAAADIQRALLREAVLSIEHNGAIICISCVAACAPFIGAVLDEEVPSLLGCIAGENMVFATPKDLQKIDQAVRDIKEVFFGGP